ncbi:MAG: hypothetical protein HGA23_05485, partial [Bacteroidales bacterium]|nr:hypothetical protein [Bacteroidales bacterium]
WYTQSPDYNWPRIQYARDADVLGRRFPPGYAIQVWFTFTGDDLMSRFEEQVRHHQIHMELDQVISLLPTSNRRPPIASLPKIQPLIGNTSIFLSLY